MDLPTAEDRVVFEINLKTQVLFEILVYCTVSYFEIRQMDKSRCSLLTHSQCAYRFLSNQHACHV